MKQVVIGTFAQLEHSLLQMLEKRKRYNPLAPLLILTANTNQHKHLKNLLAQHLGGIANVHFYDLPQLITAIWLNSLQAEQFPLTPYLREFVLRDIIANTIEERDYFGGVRHSKGFATAVATMLVTLKQNGITPQDLAVICQEIDYEKYHELQKIYAAYQQKLEEKAFYDPEDLLSKTLEMVPGCEFLSRFPNIFLYGFFAFSSLEQNFVSLVPAKQIIAFTPYRYLPAFRQVDKLLQWYRATGFEIVSAPSLKQEICSDLKLLQENVFSAKRPQEKVEYKGVKIIVAANESVEIQEVGNFLLHHPQTKAAVIVRSDSDYPTYIENIFGTAELPFSYENSWYNMPETHFLLQVVEVFCSDLAFAPIIDLATSSQLDIGKILSPELQHGFIPGQWGVVCAQMGITQGIQQWRTLLSHMESEECEQPVIKALYSFVSFFKEAQLILEQQNSFANLLREFIIVYKKISTKSSAELLKILAPITHLDLFRQQVSMAIFKEAIVVALQNTQCLPQNSDEFITVCEPQQAIGVPFASLAIVGMVEGVFPKATIQDPILTEIEQRFLNRLWQRCDIPKKIERKSSLGEKLLFHLLLDHTQSIVLSFPKIDYSGREYQKSSFMEEVLSILQIDLRKPCAAVQTSLKDYYSCQQPPFLLWPHLGDLFLMQKSAVDMQALSPLLLEYPLWKNNLEVLTLRWQQPGFTAYDGTIRQRDLLLSLQKEYSPCSKDAISPKLLEMYALCPFRFFMRHILNISAFKDEGEITPPYVQKHWIIKILRDFFAEAPQDKADDFRKVLRTIAEPALEREVPLVVSGQEMLWEAEKEKTQEKLEYHLSKEEFLQQQSNNTFSVKYGFENNNKDAASISLDSRHTIRFQNTIDRVCIEGQQITGTEYRLNKASKETGNNKFKGGELLGLAVHLLALKNIFSNLQPKRVEYNYIGEVARQKPVAFEYENWEQIKNNLEEVCHNVLYGIENGFFFPVPAPQKCRNCPYMSSCGSSRYSVYENKQEDPQIHFYHKLRSIE